MLFIRVLTDNLSPSDSRHSGSLNLSGSIAVLLIVVAVGMLLARRRATRPTLIAALWLCVWTAIAVSNRGLSTEMLREGVREASVVAVAVIVCNACGAVTVVAATRIVQVAGFVPAIVALYQLATDTGMLVANHIRSNGTFAHPNSAAMFFAIAVIASLWQYLDRGRRWFDLVLTALFVAATVATFSIDGLAATVAMLMSFGLLSVGSYRVKLVPCAVACVLVLAFFATPLGAERIALESSTSVAAAERGEPNTTLAWRFHKWETLLVKWERNPILGQGLGTTTTESGIRGNEFAGALPHNEYLRYLVETGVVGLVILLGAVAVLVRRLVCIRRRDTGLDAGGFNAAPLAIATVVGCLVDSIADNTFLNSPTCYAAALIVVSVIGVWDAHNRRNMSPRTV
ncbi:MAG TPA: O-antigen ligase family protein [Solirubrobacteraceae bacterium]